MSNVRARAYDALYGSKPYTFEAFWIRDLARANGQPPGADLLDIACGTGRHLQSLRTIYRVEGLDLDRDMLDAARERLPDVTLHHADMERFSLNHPFDIITCMFGAVAWLLTVPRLHSAIANFAHHLNPGGLLFIEPLHPVSRTPPTGLDAFFADQAETKAARMHVHHIDGNVLTAESHFLVATPEDGVVHYVEPLTIGLFDRADYEAAMHAAGLEVKYEAPGLFRFGLFLGRKPLK